MTRAECIERLVLGTISDDFENVDQVILKQVAEQAKKCGITVDRSDVIAALLSLVEAGLAKAYELSAYARDPFSGELLGMPPLDSIETDFKTYFYITPEGMALHLADASAAT